jgi:hypothetical protein
VGHRHKIETAAVKLDSGNEVLRIAESADFTHWIFELIDSLAAVVIRCRI